MMTVSVVLVYPISSVILKFGGYYERARSQVTMLYLSNTYYETKAVTKHYLVLARNHINLFPA